jgi:hypothetical protein
MLAAHIHSFMARIIHLHTGTNLCLWQERMPLGKRMLAEKWKSNSLNTEIKCTSKTNRFLTHKSPHPISTNASIIDIHNDNYLEKCAACNQIIHPNFVGHHKCGYANCPICKEAITNSEYWRHIRSHPGHESDAPLRKNVDDLSKNMRQRALK